MTLTARPTTYNGIKMRSRLEARYAAMLDAMEATWEYEPCAYANASGQYLPDFLVTALDGKPMRTFVEVRPTLDRAYLAMSQMPVIWDSEPDARLFITVLDSDSSEGIAFHAYSRDRTWRRIA